jgi:hypothetical protein
MRTLIKENAYLLIYLAFITCIIVVTYTIG